MRAEFEKENEDPGEGYLQKLEERLLQGDKQELVKEASDETEVIDGQLEPAAAAGSNDSDNE